MGVLARIRGRGLGVFNAVLLDLWLNYLHVRHDGGNIVMKRSLFLSTVVKLVIAVA